jgi:hypothetical protein
MKLQPLYTLRYVYPEGWAVNVGGATSSEEQHFYPAEGRCVGAVAGTFRGANYPRRRSDGTFVMEMKGVIETDEGSVIMTDFQGYGRTYPRGRRQVVGSVRHVAADERYARLNDAVCVLAGEVRVPDHPAPIEQHEVGLVFEVCELVWEPPPP